MRLLLCLLLTGCAPTEPGADDDTVPAEYVPPVYCADPEPGEEPQWDGVCITHPCAGLAVAMESLPCARSEFTGVNTCASQAMYPDPACIYDCFPSCARCYEKPYAPTLDYRCMDACQERCGWAVYPEEEEEFAAPDTGPNVCTESRDHIRACGAAPGGMPPACTKGWACSALCVLQAPCGAWGSDEAAAGRLVECMNACSGGGGFRIVPAGSCEEEG